MAGQDRQWATATGTHQTQDPATSGNASLDPSLLCPRGLDGPSDNNSQPPHPPAIYCSEESNMMRDRGGRGNIWFIWKGPRVNRSCGTAAKFPGAQLVDVCGTPHPSTGGTRGRQRGTEPKNMRGNQKDIKAKRSMPVR